MKTIYIVAFLVLCAGCDTPRTPKQGELAPEIVVQDLAGNAHQLSAYRGKLVLLHFWTDWCDACRKEFPKIQTYYQNLQGEEFEILAVNVGQPVAVAQNFKDEFGISFPMMTDEKRNTVDVYNLRAYPTNYLINKEGIIVRRIVGWVDEQQITALIHNIKVNQ